MTYPGIENDPAALAGDPDRVAVEQRRREREEEFGAYVASREIPWGNVLAFTKYEPVPKSTVERLKWDQLGFVVAVGSPEYDELMRTRPGGATSEAALVAAGSTSSAAALAASQPVEQPARNASQAAWAAYAISLDADAEQVSTMSRDELVAEYAKEA